MDDKPAPDKPDGRLTLEPRKDDQAGAPRSVCEWNQTEQRLRTDRRLGHDRRELIRFEEDRRAGNERRAGHDPWGAL